MKYLLAFLSLFLVLSVRAQTYNDIVTYNYNKQATYGFKIKTNVPFTNGISMPAIWIEGYDFALPGTTLNLSLVWYVLSDGFIRTSASSSGGTAPPIKIANENGKVSIFLNYKGYYDRFRIRAFAQGKGETADMFAGWTVVDSLLIPEATAVYDVPYTNTFAGTVNLPDSVISTSDGKFGIGTLTPKATLDVGTMVNDTTTAILSRLYNGSTTKDGTQLGVRAYSTTSNAPMFGIIQKYFGNINAGLIFNTGGTRFGGYLTFLTNDGTEKMRLDSLGNLGIGTTATSKYKLSVAGTIGAKKIQVTQSGWPDYVFESNYQLPSLMEIENYVQQHKHLPEVPTEKEVTTNGLDLGEMNKVLLKKVEELTLYLIEEHKQNVDNQERMQKMEKELAEIKKAIQ